MYGFCAAAPAGPSEGLAAVVALVAVVTLGALAALGAVVIPRGSRAAEDVADKPTGRTAATTTPASMPRIVLFRMNLVMSGDLSGWFGS
jgi:hypothetical protein